jgi:hypothetical protein
MATWNVNQSILAVFILETHYASARIWASILLFVWLYVFTIKTGMTRRIMRLDELCSVLRLNRRTTVDNSLSRRIVLFVPVFLLKTHNSRVSLFVWQFVWLFVPSLYYSIAYSHNTKSFSTVKTTTFFWFLTPFHILQSLYISVRSKWPVNLILAHSKSFLTHQYAPMSLHYFLCTHIWIVR